MVMCVLEDVQALPGLRKTDNRSQPVALKRFSKGFVTITFMDNSMYGTLG